MKTYTLEIDGRAVAVYNSASPETAEDFSASADLQNELRRGGLLPESARISVREAHGPEHRFWEASHAAACADGRIGAQFRNSPSIWVAPLAGNLYLIEEDEPGEAGA